MKLLLLNKQSVIHRGQLLDFLTAFQKEVYSSNTVVDLDCFIDNHYAIYLIVADDKKIVGFSAFVINHYYSLREPTVGNTYLYIDKEYRRSKAMHLVSIQAGHIALELGYPLEHYIADGSGSEKFVGRLNGKKVYTTYEFELSEVERETNRLKDKVNIRN